MVFGLTLTMALFIFVALVAYWLHFSWERFTFFKRFTAVVPKL